MRPSSFVLTLALFLAMPLAALADLHVNVIQTHEFSKSPPYPKWNASITVRKSCQTKPVVCWGDGTVVVAQDGEHYQSRSCALSVWHADMAAKDNPGSICKWHWVNDNTIDLTIKN